ncbi:MAG: dihydroorotate dehydrogenase [Chloroflexi bacterium]|nr:dihydroorotate dehydrogenase [Chloroflexota bacterium]
MNKEPDLSVVLGKIKLKNPVMPASGTFGYGEEYAGILNLEDLGAVIVKGTTLKPRLGSPQYRSVEIAGSLGLHTVGLQNVGVDRFIKDKLPYLRRFATPLIVNIAGESVEDFARLAEVLTAAGGVRGFQINLGCPNVKKGGLRFSAHAGMTFDVVKAVRNSTDLTIIPKVAQTATDIVVLAKACEEAGADAIRPNVAHIGMAIDIRTRKSKLGASVTGAMSGPALMPASLRAVWQVVKEVGIPVVGGGGITCAEDALQFFMAGATAVEIGTHNLVNPRVTIDTIQGLKKYLSDNGIASIRDVIGTFVA